MILPDSLDHQRPTLCLKVRQQRPREGQGGAEDDEHRAEGLQVPVQLGDRVPRGALGAALEDEGEEAEGDVDQACVVGREAAQEQQEEAAEADEAAAAEDALDEDAAVEAADGQHVERDHDEADDAADRVGVRREGDADGVQEGVGLVRHGALAQEGLQHQLQQQRQQLEVEVHDLVRVGTQGEAEQEDRDRDRIAREARGRGHRDGGLLVRHRAQSPRDGAQTANGREGPDRDEEGGRELDVVLGGRGAPRSLLCRDGGENGCGRGDRLQGDLRDLVQVHAVDLHLVHGDDAEGRDVHGREGREEESDAEEPLPPSELRLRQVLLQHEEEHGAPLLPRPLQEEFRALAVAAVCKPRPHALQCVAWLHTLDHSTLEHVDAAELHRLRNAELVTAKDLAHRGCGRQRRSGLRGEASAEDWHGDQPEGRLVLDRVLGQVLQLLEALLVPVLRVHELEGRPHVEGLLFLRLRRAGDN
eukprot:CAMPEP_0175498330 /NCGR_PEP_ID=MMETSP0096-20121207/5260_1 /TAXON_ID=311494 /ORGANISM="Alexandrium monilatum, Strain CCMP3105" /LENGTH=473 /DNA_ID=CAMNT_0016800357 /DNA_START=59 /DNA_END=1479 /DNA_ORIENTATION=-